MNTIQTAQIMAILNTAYPAFYKSATEESAAEAVRLWQRMFADDPYELVQAAVHALICTDEKGYPPHIGQVKAKMRLLTKRPEMTPLEAWTLVSKAVQRSAYYSEEEFAKLPPEVQAVVRTPEQLRAWALSPADTLETVTASNFQRSFRAKSEQLAEIRALPPSVLALVQGLPGADGDNLQRLFPAPDGR